MFSFSSEYKHFLIFVHLSTWVCGKKSLRLHKCVYTFMYTLFLHMASILMLAVFVSFFLDLMTTAHTCFLSVYTFRLFERRATSQAEERCVKRPSARRMAEAEGCWPDGRAAAGPARDRTMRRTDVASSSLRGLRRCAMGAQTLATNAWRSGRGGQKSTYKLTERESSTFF